MHHPTVELQGLFREFQRPECPEAGSLATWWARLLRLRRAMRDAGAPYWSPKPEVGGSNPLRRAPDLPGFLQE